MKSTKQVAVGTLIAACLGVAATLDRGEVATPRITDGEIAMIAVVAGNIDTTYAHLALALSQDPRVRAFAKTMIQDHPAVKDAAGGLVQQLRARGYRRSDIGDADFRIAFRVLSEEVRTVDGLYH